MRITREYGSKIEQERPAKTHGGERQESISFEARKHIRTAAYLHNAAALAEGEQYLKNHTKATAEDLKHHVEVKGYKVDEDALQILSEHAAGRQEHLSESLTALRERFPDAPSEAAALYEYLTGEKPTGEVTLNTENPIAWELLTNDYQDGQRLVGNAEGEYRQEWTPANGQAHLVSPWLPLVVAKNQQTMRHEIGHGTNDLFRDNLARIKKHANSGSKPARHVWGNLSDTDRDVAPSPDEDALVGRLNVAYGQAKNELLAEYAKTGELNHHLLSLLEQNGPYDYLKDIRYSSHGEAAYQKAWDSYKTTVVEAARDLEFMDSSYATPLGRPRKVLLAWILRQIPLQKWHLELANKTEFLEEARLLKQVESWQKTAQDNSLLKKYEDILSALRSDRTMHLQPELAKLIEQIQSANEYIPSQDDLAKEAFMRSEGINIKQYHNAPLEDKARLLESIQNAYKRTCRQWGMIHDSGQLNQWINGGANKSTKDAM